MDSTDDDARERAFLDARRKARPLDEGEIRERLARASSREHWRSLCPALTIEGTIARAPMEARPLTDPERDTLLQNLATEGYFRAPVFLRSETVRAMRHAVEALVAAGWPPVFAYVFDEFWSIFSTPSLVSLFTRALGPGYRRSPRVWAFFIPTERGAAGWPPHVDGGAGTHTPDRLTLWIPLSDATLDNGCMYLIPKDRVPPSTADDFANNMGVIDPRRWRTMLQSCRAMPAGAGSVLCWDFQVIHWSSLCGDAEEPRVSLAVEVLGERIEPTASEEPRIDPRDAPPFEARLAAIARGIVSYERFEPGMLRHVGLARRLLDAIEVQ